MLRFPTISCSINRHQCKLLWLKSPPRKGRMDVGAGAEIKGSEQSRCKTPLGSLAWKGSYLTVPGTPQAPGAPAAPCPSLSLLSTGYLIILAGTCTQVQGSWPGVGARWAGRASWSVTGRSAVPILATEAGGRQLWAPCRAVALGLSFTKTLSLVIPGL